MKQACIRCVVQLTLDEFRWKDERGIDIQLTGAPVFLRACVLGQLQHTHLHKPSFPITINQTLTFDRILSNCRNPSLFKEVIRGEHVKLEIIQITPDYKGGKILAKFDCPAHQFLYPDDGKEGVEEEEEEDQRIMVLNHSKHYRVPPEVTYASSTVLLDATVKSPIHVLFPADSSSSGEEESCGEDDEALTLTALRRSRSPSPRRRGVSRRRLFSPGHSSGVRATRDGRGGRSSGRRSARGRGVSPGPHQPNVAGLSKSLTAQERLHSLLSSYVESNGAAPPPPAGAGGRQAPYRVKFKPTHHRSRRELEDSVSPPPPARHGPPYYISPTRLLGPHHWTQCPRRSPERLRKWDEADDPPERSRSTSPYHRDCTPPTSPSRPPRPRPACSHRQPDSLPTSPPLLSPSSYSPPTSPLPPRPRSPFLYSPPVSPRPMRHQSPPNLYIPTSPRPLRSPSPFPCTSPAPPRPRSPRPQSSSPGCTVRNGVPLSVLKNTKALQQIDPALHPTSKGLSDVRPPFVVRHVDESWLSKRDFCGTSLTRPVGVREGLPSSVGVEGVGGKRNKVITSDEVLLNQGGPLGRGQRSITPERGEPLSGVRSPPSPGRRREFPRRSESPMARSAPMPCIGSRGRGRDVVSHYLPRAEPELDHKSSLAGTIEERIERLKKECCEFLCCPDDLGEDSLTEDLDRLQASLQGERDEALERSSRLIPEKSVTLQIGPRDYWSQRMSELTGTRHRVIFDQTLKKIYNRLYTEASMTP